MPTVAELHQQRSNIGAWLLVISGVRYMFTNVRDLEGTGPGSWINTSDREVLVGLVPPRELHLGETDPWAATIAQPRATEIGLLDFYGVVASLFRDYDDPDTTDTLGSRLSPLEDPAPDPAEGVDASAVTVWGRHVGIEAIGPAGERRWLWITPDDVPPGLDHCSTPGWPPVRVTDRPSVWAGREIAIYRIVYDPSTGTWPSWQDQYDGGSLRWYGRLVDRGTFRHTADGLMLRIQAKGPASWLERSCNLLRPTRWYRPIGGVVLGPERRKIAAWIEPIKPIDAGDGVNSIVTRYTAQTLASGNLLTGVTREELWAEINDVVQTMITGADNGAILAATNSLYVGPGVSDGLWNDGTPDKADREVRISQAGGTIKIKCEADAAADRLGFRVVIAVDVTILQLAGWDLNTVEVRTREEMAGVCPVGGPNYGEDVADQVLPPYHAALVCSTRNEAAYWETPDDEWDNEGKYRECVAPYQLGTVTLNPEGGDELQLAIGTALAEGQHGYPWTKGATLDGELVDTSGYWLFRGQRLLAADYLAGNLEPQPYAAVALCEWVRTSEGDGVEVDSVGYARIRVLRILNPYKFGLPFEPLLEPWVNVLGGLECAPIGVIGGTSGLEVPDWRSRFIPRTLLSSGTATWDASGDTPTPSPGANQPPDMPQAKKWAGDIEVADLGLGLPWPFVDWQSFERAAQTLPGGPNKALNRAVYPVFGSRRISRVLDEAMAGAGWAWSLKRMSGGKVLAFGAYDPVRPLTLADVEVTLTRDDMPEEAITTGPQWRGEVDLRNQGPYDRFTFSVDRSPLDDRELAYSLSYESGDPDRRYRGGLIDWEINDGGLRDPAPWLGTIYQELYDWTELARQRFAYGFGYRHARQLRIYRSTYDARFSTRLGLGTVVRVIDSTAVSPDGTIGIDHIGRVIEAAIGADERDNENVRVAIELERYPAGQLRVWAPYAVAGRNSWDGALLTVAPDYFAVGNGHNDTRGFVQPDWASAYAAGQLRVRVYQSETGKSWPDHYTSTADVVAVDEDNNTLSLTVVNGRIFRDMHKVVVMAPRDEQTAEWALAIYAPITAPDGKWNGVDKGTRLK